jgi:hypothetical protein
MNFKSKHIILPVLLLSTAFVCFAVLKIVFNDKSEDFKTEVYKTNNGYGYFISYGSKLLIKQDFIPSIQRNQSFCNFDDAQKVANLVVEKLNKKENPRISVSELNMLHIQLNCVN